jgi:hypothetical protein
MNVPCGVEGNLYDELFLACHTLQPQQLYPEIVGPCGGERNQHLSSCKTVHSPCWGTMSPISKSLSRPCPCCSACSVTETPFLPKAFKCAVTSRCCGAVHLFVDTCRLAFFSQIFSCMFSHLRSSLCNTWIAQRRSSVLTCCISAEATSSGF